MGATITMVILCDVLYLVVSYLVIILVTPAISWERASAAMVAGGVFCWIVSCEIFGLFGYWIAKWLGWV